MRLKDFTSIKACDVELGPLTLLVGPNGSGKSNFVDALRLTGDALSSSLDHALRDRGGIEEVRRRSGGHPHHFGVRLDLSLPSGADAHYSFKVGSSRGQRFVVSDEECKTSGPVPAHYRTRAGEVVDHSLTERLPAVAPDQLFLVRMGGDPAFAEVYRSLTQMGLYSLSPATIRQLQQPDPGVLLRPDGSNLASVLGHLRQGHGPVLERIVEYVSKVAPGVTDVAPKRLGPMETIEFRQRMEGREDPWRFPASSMSDGTLRSLGVLVALLQRNARAPTLIAVEEPETALHPAAVAVLVDAIRDATTATQVVVTSHSPDLLDREDITEDELLAVVASGGITRIGRVDVQNCRSLREQLFTAGELLRMDELRPDDRSVSDAAEQQLGLFG